MKKILLIGILSLFIFSGYASADISLKWYSTADTIVAYDGITASDTDGDGKYDTLYTAGMVYDGTDNSGEGICLALDAQTGEEIWRRNYVDADGSNKLNPIELYDITGDGAPEVFTHWGAPTGGYQIGFICFDGLTGETIWENRDSPIRPAWHHFVIVCDKESNIPYIIFNSHEYLGSYYMRKLNALTGQEVASIPSGGTCNGGVSAADLEGDGDVEFIIGLHNPPGFVCYNDELEVQWTAGVDTQSSTQCPTLVDITGPVSGVPDGVLDCVSLVQTAQGSTNGGITVVSGVDGSVDTQMTQWNLNMGFGAHGQGSVYDIDFDGEYEMTTGWGTPAVILKLGSPVTYVGETDLSFTGPPSIYDIIGDNHPELICGGYVHDWQTFDIIPGISLNMWSPKVADIDGDGLMEIFGPRNGQVSCYDTDKPALDLIQETAHAGYRRMSSQEVYDPCPGTWWYSWAEWEDDNGQPPPDITCWACDNGNAVSSTFPAGTVCGEGSAVNFPYQYEPDDCSIPPKVCYTCLNGEVTQVQVPATDICPDGWTEEIPDCDEIELPIPGFELIFFILGLLFIIWRKKK